MWRLIVHVAVLLLHMLAAAYVYTIVGFKAMSGPTAHVCGPRHIPILSGHPLVRQGVARRFYSRLSSSKKHVVLNDRSTEYRLSPTCEFTDSQLN